MVYVITIGLAVLAVLTTYVEGTCVGAEVTLHFTIGLALRAAVKKYVTVICSAEVVIQLYTIGLALCAWVLIQNVMADLYLLKIGLRALVREPREQRDYLISVLKMPATFLVMVWGVVERELERTGSMVHGRKEVRSPNWNFRSCLRTPVRCNLGTGFILARQ